VPSNASGLHEVEKLPLIEPPVTLALLEGVQDVGGGRQKRLVNIVDAAEALQEPGEVVRFREARELRGVVQADVHDAPDAGGPEASEEVRSAGLREADRRDSQEIHSVGLQPLNEPIPGGIGAGHGLVVGGSPC
jgi:hypothetical protein